MRWTLGVIATALMASWAVAQDLGRPLDAPGEIEKSLGDVGVVREPSGRLPTPPPPPARPQLARAAVDADAAAIRKAWLVTQTPDIKLIAPGDDAEWTEGAEIEFAWETAGPITDVRIYYYGGKTKLGGRDRGSFEGYITEKTPNTGRFTWKMPWIDAISMGIRIAGLDENGDKLAVAQGGVRFRPAIMSELAESGSLVAISKTHQRLYFQEAGKIVRVHIVSTAAGGSWTPTMRPGSTDRRRGRMGQVFYKSGNAWSRRYECWMPYWMAITSSGSHGIHATSSNFYWKLGRPASHGCIRQHRSDARVLYGMVGIGTPVYVFQ